MKSPAYVLVTPVRNEEATIRITIESVLHQTILPREWVIVSDESTDGTDRIIQEYAGTHPFVRHVRLEGRPERSFSSVVFVTEAGYKALRSTDYDYIGLLDADIRLSPEYYERLLAKFVAEPQLGVAGGLVYDVVEGDPERVKPNLNEVAGAVQMFRKGCFESMGGLLAIPEGGWDTITCVCARMNGFRTQTFPDLLVEHLKPRNVVFGHPLKRKWQMGVRDRILGTGVLFEALKCCARIAERPFLLASVARFGGFAWSGLSRRPTMLPEKVRLRIRQEQASRLRSLFTRKNQTALDKNRAIS
jgi:poly-beta-1,6-N-acetyl-D-glucosamine synthase